MPSRGFRLELPTPVRQLELPGAQRELWLKNDGLTHELYGGNKLRKAVRLLEHAAERGARRVLTFGAAGSHHVLATALLAPAFGLDAAAILTPQPYSAHAAAVLGRSLNAGLEAYPASCARAAVWSLFRGYRRGDYLIPPGGSNARGAQAYAHAFGELEAQIAAGLLPVPDWIVVPLGSGGTAAGLLAGLARSRLPTRLLAVSVLRNPFAAAQVRFLAGRTLRSLGGALGGSAWQKRLVVDPTQVGRGYGFATAAGERALHVASSVGLELEATYTAKAFAAALELVASDLPRFRDARRVLYWHTASAASERPALTAELPPELARLFFKPA